MTFKSKVDGWYYAVIVLVVLLIGSTTIPLIQQQASRELLVVVASMFFTIGLMIWLLKSTYYVVEKEHLVVRCGPKTWRIALRDIQSVKPSKSPLSAPALSLKRLKVSYGNNRSILVSPEDPDKFIEALGAR